jgi:tellurium resistance protein TerZ
VVIPLRDTNGAGLESVFVGLGWDPLNRRRWFGPRSAAVDLNAAALLFSGDRPVEVVYHEQFLSADGAVRLHGDNLDGTGPGDDEVITIDLTRLAPPVTAVALLVTCYTGQTFAQIENAFCRLADTVSQADIARYELRDGSSTGFVMGALLRAEPGWQFHEIAAPLAARHPADAVPLVQRYLRSPS